MGVGAYTEMGAYLGEYGTCHIYRLLSGQQVADRSTYNVMCMYMIYSMWFAVPHTQVISCFQQHPYLVCFWMKRRGVC